MGVVAVCCPLSRTTDDEVGYRLDADLLTTRMGSAMCEGRRMSRFRPPDRSATHQGHVIQIAGKSKRVPHKRLTFTFHVMYQHRAQLPVISPVQRLVSTVCCSSIHNTHHHY